MEKLDKLSVYGYLVFALDGLYLDGQAVTDDQRQLLLEYFRNAIEHLRKLTQ